VGIYEVGTSLACRRHIILATHEIISILTALVGTAMALVVLRTEVHWDLGLVNMALLVVDSIIEVPHVVLLGVVLAIEVPLVASTVEAKVLLAAEGLVVPRQIILLAVREFVVILINVMAVIEAVDDTKIGAKKKYAQFQS